MTSHSYNTRSNSLASNGNVPENSIEMSPEISSDNRPATLDTCELIIILEKKKLTRFDGLNRELMNIKDVTLKDLQIENQRLRSKINNLEEKVIEILHKIEVNVTTQDIKVCHRAGKSKKNSKKTITCFINGKYAKKVLFNRKVTLKDLRLVFQSRNRISKEDPEKLAAYCTGQILKAKNAYLIRITNLN